MMPYVNPHYYFMVFKSALIACFTTSNRLGVVFLMEILPESCVKEWRANPKCVPRFSNYSEKACEFDHTANHKVGVVYKQE